MTEVSQRNSGGSGQANGTSSSPSSGVSSQVTSSNGGGGGGPANAAASVQAALAALQTGQMSLSQVMNRFPNSLTFMPDFTKVSYRYNAPLKHLILHYYSFPFHGTL